jgi:D-glycero-D-manno-heptose 1,7-bisphosphate phosphatase
MIKLVILDRDGVINYDSSDFIKSPEEWVPIPNSLEAIARLNKAGIKVAIATNQSGIARGLFTLDTLNHIHSKMKQALHSLNGHIDGIFFCPHIDSNHCDCRKPKTGLFEQIASFFQIEETERKTIPAIGDSLRDLEGAHSAGFNPTLVLTGNGGSTLKKLPDYLKNIDQFNDLATATDKVLGNV